ncbi:hypothetical protein ElyMa_004333200 [Elysia marginata]|uniref:SMB domain-containing protein n=1 Tax=Elysia marginata TaxID=1093978 RepID=A0AAV4H0S9_9GAST|nr:hypothetical protein ElyMa_004333200 [Elysia marginata]
MNSSVTTNIPENEANESLLGRFEQECLAKFITYVYEKGLCNAPSKEIFWEISKSQYTCSNRCNQSAIYGNKRECSCDSVCLLYDDCCDDFSTICPEAYALGKISYQNLDGAIPGCVAFSFASLYSHRSGEWYTTSPASSTTWDISMQLKYGSLIYPAMTLKTFTVGFSEFKVADFTLGIIFNNYLAFSMWDVRKMKPTLIPSRSILDCSGSSVKHLVHSNVADVIPWCRVQLVDSVRTSLHRNCASLNAITCKCSLGDGKTKSFFDYPQNSCAGERNRWPLLSRDEKLRARFKLYRMESFVIKTYEGEKCQSQNVEKVDFESEPLLKALDFKKSLKIIISPTSLSSTVSTVSAEKNKAYESADKTFATPIPTILEDESLNEQSFEFVVELTKTLERRLRCPSLNSYLSNCRLEECVPGALVLTDGPSYDNRQLNNARCFLPTAASLHAFAQGLAIPLCTCMRFLAALSDLNIWKISVDHAKKDQCFFRLQVFQENPDDAEEVIFDGKPKMYTFTDTAENTRQRLQNLLYTSKAYCLQDNVYRLRICFFTHVDGENPASSNCSMSMELFPLSNGPEVVTVVNRYPLERNQGQDVQTNSSIHRRGHLLSRKPCLLNVTSRVQTNESQRVRGHYSVQDEEEFPNCSAAAIAV